MDGAAQVGVALCKTKQSETGKGLNERVQTKALSSGDIWWISEYNHVLRNIFKASTLAWMSMIKA